MAKALMVPTIHLNGSARSTLFEATSEAGHALRKAIDALALTSPHGRDYYPQGDGALKKATAEHVDRVKRLESVLKELTVLAEHIADAPGPK